MNPEKPKKKSVGNKPQNDSVALVPFTLFTVEPTKSASQSPGDELTAQHIIAKIRKLQYFKVPTLVELVVGLINELERLEEDDLLHVLWVARNRVTWPVLAGRHTAIQKKNAARFNRIELGTDVRPILDLREVPINPTPARLCALALIEIVEQTRFHAATSELIYNFKPEQMREEHFARLRGSHPVAFTHTMFSEVVVNWSVVFEIGILPDLVDDSESIAMWQKAALKLLDLNSNGHPEDIPELYALGEHRRFQPLTIEEIANLGFVPGVDYSDFSLKKQKSNIANEIRSILRGEIKKLARDLGKVRPAVE